VLEHILLGELAKTLAKGVKDRQVAQVDNILYETTLFNGDLHDGGAQTEASLLGWTRQFRLDPFVLSGALKLCKLVVTLLRKVLEHVQFAKHDAFDAGLRRPFLNLD